VRNMSLLVACHDLQDQTRRVCQQPCPAAGLGACLPWCLKPLTNRALMHMLLRTGKECSLQSSSNAKNRLKLCKAVVQGCVSHSHLLHLQYQQLQCSAWGS
jgi:hypothetical protein